MIYEGWGFSKSPFEATPLPPTELGRRLLVGRDVQTQQLIRRIESPPQLPTIEGINGIGKTSVANVAAYLLYRKHIERGIGPLFIPCRKIFQLSSHADVQSFVDVVLIEVAQTLIERASDLTKSAKGIDTGPLNRWLNSPQLTTYSGGIWVVQAGAQSQNNTSGGFESSGLRKMVLGWLDRIFSPSDGGGGVVCMIDNLELLQQSATARHLLEQLRDELFNIPGLRWVLCGALGIVYGVASSPRLEGYLHRPIELTEMEEKFAPHILTSRIEAYATRADAYLPLLATDFAELYSILKGNLRTLLSYAENYCQWIADGTLPRTDEEKHEKFTSWLRGSCESFYSAVKPELRPKTLEVFKIAVSIGGIFSPSDYNFFGFNSSPVFRPKIADLEELGLVVSTQDESDKRRKTIQITPKGWMVNYYIEHLIH
jgi:hypothetical protein